MTKIERWILRWIFKRLFRQSFTHQENITNVYRLVREAVENEFTEDNQATVDHNLRFWFELTQRFPNNR